MAKLEPTAKKKTSNEGLQKSRINQTDVPSMSLEKAMRIPLAIAENYGYRPASPIQVASALDMQPSTGGFRMLAGAAVAYGLATGGAFADVIGISPLGLRIVRCTSEGDDLAAKREALLKPRVIKEFLEKYDRAPVPKIEIAKNVLIEMGVPKERTEDVLNLILDGAASVGFIREIKDKRYVELDAVATTSNFSSPPKDDSEVIEERSEVDSSDLYRSGSFIALQTDTRSKRVFITHGKNRQLIEPIKKLLSFGDLRQSSLCSHRRFLNLCPGKSWRRCVRVEQRSFTLKMNGSYWT